MINVHVVHLLVHEMMELAQESDLSSCEPQAFTRTTTHKGGDLGLIMVQQVSRWERQKR